MFGIFQFNGQDAGYLNQYYLKKPKLQLDTVSLHNLIVSKCHYHKSPCMINSYFSKPKAILHIVSTTRFLVFVNQI